MWRVLLALTILAAGAPAFGQVQDLRDVPDEKLRHWLKPGDPISVPSDGARYSLVDFTPTTGAQVVVTTKRVGRSGTSFARRLIDCRAQTFAYIGEGDTLAELDENIKKRQKNPDPLTAYVDQSISWYIARASCMELSVVLEERRRHSTSR
jgi:hypothetical protein